jgi:hypothetical protein
MRSAGPQRLDALPSSSWSARRLCPASAAADAGRRPRDAAETALACALMAAPSTRPVPGRSSARPALRRLGVSSTMFKTPWADGLVASNPWLMHPYAAKFAAVTDVRAGDYGGAGPRAFRGSTAPGARTHPARGSAPWHVGRSCSLAGTGASAVGRSKTGDEPRHRNPWPNAVLAYTCPHYCFLVARSNSGDQVYRAKQKWGQADCSARGCGFRGASCRSSASDRTTSH